jgi:hypothetical protein
MSNSFDHRRASVAQFLALQSNRQLEALAPFQRRRLMVVADRAIRDTEAVLAEAVPEDPSPGMR